MHSCWGQPLYQAKDTHSPEAMQKGYEPMPPTMCFSFRVRSRVALRSGAIAASTVASRSSSQCVGVAFRSLLT